MLTRGKVDQAPKTRDYERTHQRLLATARRLFAVDGYGDTGTPALVEAAGLTRGALYHHYADKKALFRAVVEEIEREILAEIEARATAETDPWRGLLAGCHAFLDVCQRPDVRRILLQDAPAVLGWAAWRAIDADYGVGSLDAGVRACQDAGYFEGLPARAVTHLVSGALNEAVFLIADSDDPQAVRAEIDLTLERLLAGLAGQRRERRPAQ